MVYVVLTRDRLPSGRRTLFAGKSASVIAALSFAAGSAAWIADFDPVASISDPVSGKSTDLLPFEARFLPTLQTNAPSIGFSERFKVQSLSSEVEIKFEQAKAYLSQKPESEVRKAPLTEEAKPSAVANVPLPRSRPTEANLELQSSRPTAQADDRTLLQKLSDMLPVTLASLAPDGGLLGGGPDLASFGLDNLTAVYDISARTVYMPNGSKLEAHSGFGRLMDDPGRVNEQNVGATPPNTYDLKPREQPFHGVQAIRMVPVDSGAMFGRSGMLTHSYMLGPNGDSNGCVSIKNYEKFLKAFNDGEIKRLVVVASLGDLASASRRPPSQS
jgi:Protein of unknown function (DUF2778)